MKRILTVEDEPEIAFALSCGLHDEGFDVMTARNGSEALGKIHDPAPDLVLLDVMLPDMDGFEVCRRLRRVTKRPFPILLLSARKSPADKVAGLDCGADDYITKPFDFAELLARIHASLRRSEEITHQFTRQARQIVVGDLRLNLDARQVWRGDTPIELTKREYDLLELLAQNAGQVLTKGCIFERVWGDDSEAGWEVIKVYINYVRAKINAGGKTNLIHAVRGLGYILQP